MIPAAGNTLKVSFEALDENVSFVGDNIRIDSPQGFLAVGRKDIPENVHITLRINPDHDVSSYGICLKGSEGYK